MRHYHDQSNAILAQKNPLFVVKNTKPTIAKSDLQFSAGTIIICPMKIARFFFIAVGMLLTAHLTTLYLAYSQATYKGKWLAEQYFDFDHEGNLPSFFSAISLLTASALLFLIYKTSKRNQTTVTKNSWLVLSFIFLFLCIDEAIQIHEYFTVLLHPLVTNLTNLNSVAWVLPYSVLLLAVVAYFVKFVVALPEKSRSLFIISGFIYVTGALSIELIEGRFYNVYGQNHIYSKFACTLQELLEMIGCITFIYALLDYIASTNKNILLSIK